MDIKDLVDIASLAASFAAAIGLFLVAVQTREAEKSRQLQATLAVFDDLGSEENRALRKFIYNSLPQDLADYSEEDGERVEKVCAAFNRASLLSNRKLVNRELILAMYGEATARCWKTLYSYVLDARRKHGNQYLTEFEKLAKEAEKYWKIPR